MSRRAKQACVLIVAQAVCVAVGLWMQHGNVVSSLHDTLEQQAWLKLEQQMEELSGELDESTISGLMLGAAGSPRVPARWRDRHPSPRGMMLVDSQWRVLATAGGEVHPGAPTTGQELSWVPSANTLEETGALKRGTLDFSDGMHIAVYQALDDSTNRLVVHHPRAALEADAAALARPLGAIHFVTLSWTVAVLTVAVLVVLGRIHDRAQEQRKQATADVLRPARSLVRTRDAVIFGLAKLADSRDPDTGEHLERISAYSTILAKELRRHPRYATEVTLPFVRLIGISAALHDIGKVGIEDRILLKPGSLSPEERAEMQKHSVIGGQCLRETEQRLGSSNFLQMAREITFAHHERWDGKGYPYGLAGEAIPLAARIVAIADVYDALSSKRCYKRALPHEECVAIIRDRAGKNFDPDLIEVWLTIEAEFRRIAQHYATMAVSSSTPGALEPAPLLRAGPNGQEALVLGDETEAEVLSEFALLG